MDDTRVGRTPRSYHPRQSQKNRADQRYKTRTQRSRSRSAQPHTWVRSRREWGRVTKRDRVS